MLGKHSDCPTVSLRSPPPPAAPGPKSNLPNIARALSNNDPEKVAKHIGSGLFASLAYTQYTFFIATFRFWVSLSVSLVPGCACVGGQIKYLWIAGNAGRLNCIREREVGGKGRARKRARLAWVSSPCLLWLRGNWIGFLGNCGYRAKGITSVETCQLKRGRDGLRSVMLLLLLLLLPFHIWGHLRRKFAKSIVWKLYKMAFRTVNQGVVARQEC